MLGPDDTSLRQLKVHATKRGGQFNSLDMTGVLEGGAELNATLRVQPGQARWLVANTRDTGAALKLIGFYPNMIGGKGELRVNIDGGGAVEKNGTLHVNRFKVLGDPVIAEVLQTGETGENGEMAEGADLDPECEVAPVVPVEPRTTADAIRELVKSWNVPGWNEVVGGLYRPGGGDR